MPLKTFVKVGRITNLSDARYCAGMGVDMLGFSVLDHQATYLAPVLYQEIRGWISGPKVVAEVYGLTPDTDINSILENYRPDFLELGFAELSLLQNTSLPLIVNVQPDQVEQISTAQGNIVYAILHQAADIGRLPEGILPIIEVTSTDSLSSLLTHPTVGISLNGSIEIKPGLKDYGYLSEVLEQLEVE